MLLISQFLINQHFYFTIISQHSISVQTYVYYIWLYYIQAIYYRWGLTHFIHQWCGFSQSFRNFGEMQNTISTIEKIKCRQYMSKDFSSYIHFHSFLGTSILLVGSIKTREKRLEAILLKLDSWFKHIATTYKVFIIKTMSMTSTQITF